MKRKIDIGLLLTRLAVGFPMLLYGINKLIYGISFIQEILISNGLPSFIGYGVYIGEVVAPIFIIIGFKTRLAGLVFAINCLTAIILVKSDNLLELNENGGWALELLAIYLIIGVALFFSGGGKFSLSYNTNWD